MISFGLRWRLAQGASSLARQVITGVTATVIASQLLSPGARGPVAPPPEPKITLRIEPEAEPAASYRPLIQQASEVVAVDPAPAAEQHLVKPISHKPKSVVAMLPPARPREAPDVTAPPPATDSARDWLAGSRAAFDVGAAAFDASRRWALEGKDWAVQAASGATSVVSQAVRFGP
jgi:hypothetical protein